MQTIEYIKSCQARVNAALEKLLPSEDAEPTHLHAAMRYSVFNGGKRLRAALIYAIGDELKADTTVLDTAAAVIELIHSFSLIHDDLPAIDNDDLRRGKPSCHIAFDEATALLAGDALLTLAFEQLSTISSDAVDAETKLKMIELLSVNVGSQGMAGGEALDVLMSDKELSLKELAKIYQLKTSYLICASVLLGALSANCTDTKTLFHLEKFGMNLGLAFQIQDDVLEVEVDEEQLGKSKDSDERNGKVTFPVLVGLENAKKKAQYCYDKALAHFQQADIGSARVVELSEFVLSRRS